MELAPTMVCSQAACGASDGRDTAENGALQPDSGHGRKRCRRPRRRRRQASTPGEDSHSSHGEGNSRDTPLPTPVAEDGIPLARGPPCIIDWSEHLARAEAELHKAVFVTVLQPGDVPFDGDLEVAKMAVASAFDLERDTLALRRASQAAMFILFLEAEATVGRLVNAGPTSGLGGLRLVCRRWTRQAFVEGVALPSLVDVELRGIPAHAWEMATAESVLNPYGWPQLLHSDTRNREDYSVFRLTTWCFDPAVIPASQNLHIAEPPVGDILSPPGKPTSMYPITIKVSRLEENIDEPPTPSDEGKDHEAGEDSYGGDRRR